MMVIIIIIGVTVRLAMTLYWLAVYDNHTSLPGLYPNDPRPSKKEGTRFYLIPFYWWYQIFKYLSKNIFKE